MLRICVLCLLLGVPLAAESDAWKALQFLVGEWVGEGGGTRTGQGSGGFSFRPDVQGKVMIRRNWSDYPVANGNSGLHHEDIMMIYGINGSPEALYADNEGHVISYRIEVSDGGGVIRFVNAQHRLTYRKTGANTLAGTFEIAMPGKTGEFKEYLAWTARRKQ